MQATEESVPISAVVAASMFIAEVKMNKMLEKASVDTDYRRRLASALKRADKEELVKLSEEVRG